MGSILATELPDWFIQKYSQEKETKEEPKKPTLSLYRRYLNEEFADLYEPADTQQEREKLTGQALNSTKKEIDPQILEDLANRYQKTPPVTELDITLNKVIKAKMAPTFEPGKKVFTDQERWNEIIAAAPEEGKIISFKKAFKQARDVGDEEFEYQGNRFNTRKRGETKTEWLSSLKNNKLLTPFIPGFVRERKIEEIPEVRIPVKGRLLAGSPRELSRKYLSREAQKQLPIIEKGFASYMKQTGVSLAENKNIDTGAISEKLGPALVKVAPMLESAGIKPEITSGKRNRGVWSLHEVGEAIDLRLKSADKNSLKKLKEQLPGSPIDTFIEGEKGRMWSDGTYEYIIHGKGNNIHLHIERETEESKERLVEHMIKLGLANKIPQKGLAHYPNLLKKFSSQIPKVN